jgi:D-glycero-D-manno-heptose 1,7-bisphosphate phosphatase
MSTPRSPNTPGHGSVRRERIPGVFLDRDGTINEEVGYINHLNRLHVFPWTAEAIRKLNEAKVPVIVVTNQSGVARGYFPEELVNRVNERVSQELAAQSAHVDAFYYCPHHPDATLTSYRKTCECRKPSTGMVKEAAERFHLDLQNSYVVGDSYRDMQLGFHAGTRTILVLTGYGRGELEHQGGAWPRKPDLIAKDLLEAVNYALEDLQPRLSGRVSGYPALHNS